MSEWQIIEEEFISYTGGTAQLISNGECKVHLWETPKDAQLFCDKLNAINEEKEQLKQQLNRLKTINEVKMETIKFHVDGYNRLKQTILEAYETERTELGKSVLKQLLEQIQ